ncbi:MAG: hypothetical protein QNJ63_14505 [Calothrix sp. MO_192.B10]|nr:hypothetical protein [Calothrix sp. MO_192.B10]
MKNLELLPHRFIDGLVSSLFLGHLTRCNNLCTPTQDRYSQGK